MKVGIGGVERGGEGVPIIIPLPVPVIA